MQNKKIREYLKVNNVYQYQIAEYVGVSEMTILRWMRVPLSPEKENLILQAIEVAKTKKGDD